MRCREALRSIGPYIDGELAGEKSEALKSHLEACPRCRRSMASLRGVVREVSSLVPIRPTTAESARLVNRVRSEMERPAAARPARTGPGVRWAHVTAAAVSILVLVTGAAALAILESGGPAVQVEETAAPGGEFPTSATTEKARGTAGIDSSTADSNGVEALAPASLARPAVVISGREYAPEELEDFRGDISTRLKFYSAYWQPQVAGAAAGPTEELQQRLTEDLAGQAQAAGADPERLRSAVGAALAQAESENLLPCYAELAKVKGREVWLVSFSGPEDYLLFPDPEVPQSVVLASLGGEEGLKISRSLLQELAAELAPFAGTVAAGETLYWGVLEAGAATGEEEGTGAETPEQTGGDASPGSGGAPTQAQWESEFQAFLDEVAARTNNLDAIKALERLNYEQVLMLLKGDWAGLAADGVNLSEFLTPPQRLWAVDAATAEIIHSL